MTQVQSFRCNPQKFSGLVQFVQDWLIGEDFNCQRLTTDDGGTLLQVEKKGGWRKFVGMSTSLNICFKQVENTVNVQIGAGRWLDKAVSGSVSMVILWPLAVTASMGAWEQANLPKKVYEHIGKYLG